jgi:hypothetical protein
MKIIKIARVHTVDREYSEKLRMKNYEYIYILGYIDIVVKS